MIIKILSFFTALGLVCSLAACVSESSGQETGTDPGVTTAPTVSGTLPQEEPSEAPMDPFDEIILVDDENVTAKITGVEPNGLFGYTLKVFLENKTDLQLMFSVDNVSVNGFMCDPFWASIVDAEKKANEQICFMESDFELNGIEEVTDVTFTLKVYDSNDLMTDYLVEETFTVNP